MESAELRAQLEQCHAEAFGWARCCCNGDVADAEDALQSACLKVLDGRARFEGRSSFRTWLLAVIRRTAADERRRHWLRRVGLLRWERRAERPAAVATPDEMLERTQTETLFREGLAALSRRQQEALHLVFYHDLSLSEAAAVMGVTVGSARTHYERGKARLRGWLNENNAFDESRFDRAGSPETLPGTAPER